MGRALRRAGRTASLLLTLAAFSPPTRADHHWEVLVHLRHPDGREETLRASHFRFVYYDRRFVRRSRGFGRPGTLEVEDRPHETESLQHDQFRKIRFTKILRVALEYREGEEGRGLSLVITRRKGPQRVWSAIHLRNAVSSRIPHFRGVAGDKTVDFPVPPLVESASPEGPVVIGLDFEFPGQKPRRKWF